MDKNNIISTKRISKANTKYNTNEYDTLTPSQKRAISKELKQDKKQDKKNKRKENLIKNKYETEEAYNKSIRDAVEKRKYTKELNASTINKFKIFNKDIKLNKLLNILKNYSNRTLQQLPVNIKGNNVLQLTIYKNLMTREEIKKLAQDVSNEINSLNLSGKMYTTLKYNENKYRSGKPVKFGEPVNIFTDSMYDYEDENDDQEYFNSFSMYLMENKNRPEGGFSNDNNNICFYNCIHDILKNNCPWSDGVKFKRWLNISVGDKVKISHIQQI